MKIQEIFEMLLFLGVITIATCIFLFQGYLHYFAPCSQVKEFWLITLTPARCIN